MTPWSTYLFPCFPVWLILLSMILSRSICVIFFGGRPRSGVSESYGSFIFIFIFFEKPPQNIFCLLKIILKIKITTEWSLFAKHCDKNIQCIVVRRSFTWFIIYILLSNLRLWGLGWRNAKHHSVFKFSSLLTFSYFHDCSHLKTFYSIYIIAILGPNKYF